jgi:hypothetical protein
VLQLTIHKDKNLVIGSEWQNNQDQCPLRQRKKITKIKATKKKPQKNSGELKSGK